MPPRIQLLPAALADQIAAGEVVERPASVVKELLENALDAGARRIEVEIERGGLATIVVADDGEGMTPADAHLALRRHATSKLRAAADLFQLRSFGFRGEALPSIASISELTLTTRPDDAEAGYVLRTRAGEVIEAGAAGAPRGTRVEVRGLFANVPARLKFQRPPGVEAAQVQDAVVRTALGAPHVHLRLRVDGRVTVELPSHASLAERARAVLRRSAQGRTSSVVHAEGPFLVEAHVAAPDAAQQSSRRLHLLVNRRAVRDRGLLAAVQLGFADLLPRGRYPVGVVSLTLPAADLDVNVHPQKLEVRLARAAEAHAAVRHAIARAIADGGFASVEAQRRAAAPGDPAEEDDGAFALAAGEDDDAADPEARLEERGRVYELLVGLAAGAEEAAADEARARPLARYLGALPGGYLVFAEAEGLVLVDQHAASALVRWHAGTPDEARSHAPCPTAPGEGALLARYHGALAELGFSITDGALSASPGWAHAAPLEALREVLAALVDGGPDEARARATTLAALAPITALDADGAAALYQALRALVEAGRLPALTEARWRGRRAQLRLPLSELLRRLDA